MLIGENNVNMVKCCEEEQRKTIDRIWGVILYRVPRAAYIMIFDI